MAKDYDDEDDDRPRRSRNSRDDDAPRRRRDEEDDYADTPRRGGGKPHRGTMILVFGILGFICCPIFAIVALIMGNADLKEMKAGVMDRSGEGMTRVGVILGIVALILTIVGVILQIALGGFGAMAGR